MPRIVSVIPPKDDYNITKTEGTKILLDNGEYLRCIHRITLVAEPDSPWKAIIEVYPQNQEQINAVLADLKVVKIGEAKSRLLEIQEEMQKLQDEKLFLEQEYDQSKSGVWTDGVKDVPKEGTWVLKDGETIIPLSVESNGVLEKLHEKLNGSKAAIPPATEKVKDIHGVIHHKPDRIGEQDDSEEHY